MGDERLNPYIPEVGRRASIQSVIGDTVQDDIETKFLYEEAAEKYDIYHLQVNHTRDWDLPQIDKSWKEYLDDTHYRHVTLDNIANEIVDIIETSVNNNTVINNNEGISW
jgi:hypothetical protein